MARPRLNNHKRVSNRPPGRQKSKIVFKPNGFLSEKTRNFSKYSTWNRGKLISKTDRHTDKQTDLQTERNTETQTNGQTDIQTYRKTDGQTDRPTESCKFARSPATIVCKNMNFLQAVLEYLELI